MKRSFENSNITLSVFVIILLIYSVQGASYAQEVNPTLTAFVEAPLTEATLSGSVVTLTLSGRNFTSWKSDIRDAITISGIEDVSFTECRVDRVSSSEVTIPLTFSGNIDTDATLTIALSADAVWSYNQDFTVQLPVTAVEESMAVSTEFPLTEATLNNGVVTITLSGRSFTSRERDVESAVILSGIEGVNVRTNSVDRVSDTVVTFELSFSGDFEEDAQLTITLGAKAIVGYSEAMTALIPVTSIKQTNATISLLPNPIESTMQGRKQLTINLNIAGGENVAGYQATVLYDGSTLRYVESVKGDYLADDAFFIIPPCQDTEALAR